MDIKDIKKLNIDKNDILVIEISKDNIKDLKESARNLHSILPKNVRLIFVEDIDKMGVLKFDSN